MSSIALHLFVEGKWHFKTPNRVLSHNKFQDVGEKTLEKSLILYTPFSKKLFMNPTSQKIIKEALSTTFIKGMAQGKFPLSNYRNFLEQDAAYFYHVADVYRLAAVKMDIQNNKEYANFYWRQSTKFYHLHENFIREKALSGEGQEGTALQAYKEFLSKVGPEHLALAMLPCSMLYPELARVEVQNPAGNVYEEDFFKENRRDDESSTEKFVNEIKDITEQRALLIFWRGLKHELNLLREVGDQPALPIQQL